MGGYGDRVSNPPTGDERAWHDFRDERHAELKQPFGWLTIRGFAWLPDRPGPIDGLPGLWFTDGDTAFVDSDPDSDADPAGALRRLADGTPVTGRDSCTVAETSRVAWLRHADAQIELLRRGGRLALRWRAETSPEREGFEGVPTYPYDKNWAVPARFEAYVPERRVDVATHRADLRQNLRAVGEVAFVLDGLPQRLVATFIKTGYSVEFHDPTNGTETPAWRQLKFDAPADPDEHGSGDVVLDFNRTLDMWFAFTDFATCPAPCAGNALTVAVRAGEQSPEA